MNMISREQNLGDQDSMQRIGPVVGNIRAKKYDAAAILLVIISAALFAVGEADGACCGKLSLDPPLRPIEPISCAIGPDQTRIFSIWRIDLPRIQPRLRRQGSVIQS